VERNCKPCTNVQTWWLKWFEFELFWWQDARLMNKDFFIMKWRPVEEC
jgi:hypothetical protein